MQNKEINILGQAISSGKGVQVNLDIAKLHTRTKIEVPIIIERAKKKGPTLLITGGIHGNEVNGIEIVRQLVSKGFNKPDCGMVICIPVVNVFGFLNQTREFPDGRDLNRVFPGSMRGSLASRFAYNIIKEIAPLAEYCIDYHTGGDSRFNAPQIRVSEGDKESLELAQIFEAPFIMQSKNKEKSFRSSLRKLGKKVLLFEGGKSLYLDENITNTGVAGALKVMQHLGMRDFTKEIENIETSKEAPILLNNSTWIRAKYSGMFHCKVKLGSYTNKGDIIGSISDPYGDFEKLIKASYSGYIICVNHLPIVNQGDALIHLSYEKS